MEVDEKPTEKYTDIGGLDKQIEELVEAVVWPMKEAERFKKIGIKAPKGTISFAKSLRPRTKRFQAPSCMAPLVQERPSWPEPAPLKQTPPSSNSPAHN